jgi:protein-disulfide isomerase
MMDKVATWLLVLLAGFMVVWTVSRPSSGRPRRLDRPYLVATWQDDNERGIWIGKRQAPVVLTEFMDAQCPYCARLAAVVSDLREQFGDELSVVVHHYPLRFHPHALGAAVAFECADRQLRFEPFLRLTFAQQDSIGIKPWVKFAADVGIADMGAFQQCLLLPPDSFPRIKAGLDLGARTEISGTPTVWVNGWVMVAHDSANLARAVVDAIEGRTPGEVRR